MSLSTTFTVFIRLVRTICDAFFVRLKAKSLFFHVCLFIIISMLSTKKKPYINT